MSLNGNCLCGAISYTVDQDAAEFGACHCGQCRAWSGGIYFAFTAVQDAITWRGEEAIKIFTSSSWAERGFCETCGSSLFYRVTAPGPHNGEMHMAAGTLADWKDNKVATELFIDLKPDGYALTDGAHRMTEAEVMAMFAAPPESDAAT